MDKKPLVIHPFLFAIFPVLFLYSHNVQEMFLKWTIVPAAIILVCTLLLFVILSLLCRGKHKAGLLLSILLVYFFLYGYFKEVMHNLPIFNHTRSPHIYIFFAWTTVFLVGGYFTLKTNRSIVNVTKILNVVAACLVCFSLFNIATFQITTAISRQGQNRINRDSREELPVISVNPLTLPNIYYIILDGHARNDVLKEELGYSNDTFLERLRKRGFFVANLACSNYCHTKFSLPSSLNFMYLNDLVNQVGIDSTDEKPLRELFEDNRVFKFLKMHGYSIVSFRTSYSFFNLDNTNVQMFKGYCLWSDFSRELTNNTVARSLLFLKHSFRRHYHQILYTFEHLADTAKMKPPVFVYSHFLIPHPPYVFDENGHFTCPKGPFRLTHTLLKITEKEGNMGYLGQLKYADKKIIETIDDILASSSRTPIIVLQADHGIHWNLNRLNPSENDSHSYKSSFGILNAYYFPGFDYSQLYDSISPVNTFRLVFNHYFGTNFELLKDESYFSTKKKPYKFINVTDQLKQ